MDRMDFDKLNMVFDNLANEMKFENLVAIESIQKWIIYHIVQHIIFLNVDLRNFLLGLACHY